MSHIKVPCFSLGASGSLSEAVTFTKRRGQNIVEKKPHLPYFLTLPVQYQRWLYEDYSYLWHQQSLATKQLYAASGVRHHLTGFQYWMSDMLTRLPDIVGLWRLDDNAGPTTVDNSRNSLTATVFGASPIAGIIGGAFHGDGINDQVRTPASPLFNALSNAVTIELRFRTYSITTNEGVWGAWNDAAHRVFIYIINQLLRFYVQLPGWNAGINTANFLVIGPWYTLHIICSGTAFSVYIDGQPTAILNWPTGVNFSGFLPGYLTHLFLAWTFYGWADIDHYIVYNRVLDSAERLRHSLRRYP